MYADRIALLTHYHAEALPPAEKECVMGGSPTLAVMNSTYGDGTAETIIGALLCGLNEHTSAAVKITPSQAYYTAVLIVRDKDLRGIKADELLLFFANLKTGMYGPLYNAVDSVSVTAALRKFKSECDRKRVIWADEVERAERDAERKRWREDPGRMNLEQFRQTEAYKRIMNQQ